MFSVLLFSIYMVFFSGQYKTWTADCGLGIKHGLGLKCGLRTEYKTRIGYKTRTTNHEYKNGFRKKKTVVLAPYKHSFSWSRSLFNYSPQHQCQVRKAYCMECLCVSGYAATQGN